MCTVQSTKKRLVAVPTAVKNLVIKEVTIRGVHTNSSQPIDGPGSQKSNFLLASWSGRFADVVLIFSQPRSRAGRDAGLRRRQYRAWRTRSAWGALAARGECAGGGGGCARTKVPGARAFKQRRCARARATTARSNFPGGKLISARDGTIRSEY